MSPPGTITALLGTNGAGKTSTMEVIEGLAPVTSGTLTVLGLDPIADRDEVRRRTGVLLQDSGFSVDLTVAESLKMWATTVTSPRSIEESMGRLGLESRANTPVRGLSGGEKRRLDLACTLMGDPEVILLDEPTTGLDPASRREVWNLVNDLRDNGATVLITTHYLEEAEVLADRVEIMHAGQIVRSGTPAEIAADHPSTISFTTPAAADWLLGLGADIEHQRDTTSIKTRDLQTTLLQLLTAAERDGITLTNLEARTASLESVFLGIAESEGALR